MDIPERPLEAIWDITYACPLRCTHCYSESGRRPSRQLGWDDMIRVTDAIIAMGPHGVSLAGGEPLVVRGVFEIAQRMVDAGIDVVLYTSGWSLDESMLDAIAKTFLRVNVSIDGASAAVHDRVRGRRGSFDRALQALSILDKANRIPFGVDYVVVRSNFHEMEDFCTTIAPRFANLEFVSFSAVIPEGLASRESFAEHELLSDAQVEQLGGRELAKHLQTLAPASVMVSTTDNLALQMHPERIRRRNFFPVMQIEPDGAVRAMTAYEGTVGNLLTDSPVDLWQRAIARWSDPFVVETLHPVQTMKQWAEATRKIDYHFGSADDRARIDRRPQLTMSD